MGRLINNGPCKTCPNKGCGAYHNECEPYLEWKRLIEAEKAKVHDNKIQHTDWIAFKKAAISAYCRRRDGK